MLRSLNSNYKHNLCLFSTASISYTFDKFCSTELSFKDHALGGTSYNGQYGEAPPETGIFFSLQVYERVGILLVEVYKRVGKSVSWVCERAQTGLTDELHGYIKSRKRSFDFCLKDSAFRAVKRDTKF